MYIKMEQDKSLIITVPTSIYQGESNAGALCFLLPQQQEEIKLADCAVFMRYVLPDGTGYSEALFFEPETYREYLKYTTLAKSRFTAHAGTVKLWLCAFNFDDAVVLKTGEIDIEVLPSKNIDNYLPPESLDQIDRLTKQVEVIQKTKADNIVFNDKDSTLQLSSEKNLIGDAVDLSKAITGDDVIHFGSGSGGDEPPDPDEVIHF